MRAAQGLYEKGYITYMRTDSTTLSDTALQAARSMISERYGASYLPGALPALCDQVEECAGGARGHSPCWRCLPTAGRCGEGSSPVRSARYELIWQRTVASQMTDCTGETVTLKLGAATTDGRDVEFSATGTVIAHTGFREVYEESRVQERETKRTPTSAGCRRLPRAMPLVRPVRSSSRDTPRRRRRATPRHRWSNVLRNSASAAPRPMRRSSGPSRTAAMSGRRGRHLFRRSLPSRWST